jgi:hypothetical protein
MGRERWKLEITTMTIPASGPINLTDVQTEFGGQVPIDLGDYYAGGAYVGAGTTGTYGPVPSSGPISLRDFYGTSRITTTVNYIATQYTVGQYITSADGITWTARNFPIADAYLWVARGTDKWVAFPSSGTTALYSSDGINWTSTTLPVSATWSTIGYTGTRFVAAPFGSSTTGVWSSDGINWNVSTLPSGYFWFRTSGGNGVVIVTTAASNVTARTTDGVTWTLSSTPASSALWCNAASNGNNWAIVPYCNNDTSVISSSLRSTDNANSFAYGGNLPSAGIWYSVAYAKGNFVTVMLRTAYYGYNPNNRGAYSSDGGVTWNAVTLPATQEWVGTSYAQPFSNVVTIGLGSNVGLYSSDGGVTWTQITLPITGNWNGVAAK